MNVHKKLPHIFDSLSYINRNHLRKTNIMEHITRDTIISRKMSQESM